jgi:subtilase family serine protease
MSEQWGPGPGQSGSGAAATATKELYALQQAKAHLVTTENHLELQRSHLQSQIAAANWQAQYGRQMGRDDLVRAAAERGATLQKQLVAVREQMARISARKTEILQRQGELMARLRATPEAQPQWPTFTEPETAWPSAPPTWPQPTPDPAWPGSSWSQGAPPTWQPTPSQGGPPQGAPPWITPKRPSNRSRRLLIILSSMAVLILLVSLALGGLRLLHSAASALTQPTQATSPTATPFPSPVPLQPFQPDGSGPTSQQCLAEVGIPCYSPEQIQAAYSLNTLYREGYAGLGQTIVILGAGHTSTLQADLQHFDQTWGLPDPPSFQIIQQADPVAPYTCPDGVDDLALESTLDVEWSHAIAPKANIILLIGSNDSGISNRENCSFSGMPDALDYALEHHLGQVISISFGGSELGEVSETASDHASDKRAYQQVDQLLKTAADNGITVVAAVGDDGATNPDGGNTANAVWNQPNIAWPASDPYVLAVGGTTLQINNTSGAYQSEQVWNDRRVGATGGGLSTIFPEPAYQQGIPDQALFQGERGIPDVSFSAANFDVYASFENGAVGQIDPAKWRHWDILFGTSVSAPCWAGLVAIADQMHGKPMGQIQPALYSLGGKGFHDITKGNNTFAGVQGYSARSGYDLATGWGTPIADQLIPALVSAYNNIGG